MPEQKLTIVPVTLHPETENITSTIPATPSSNSTCTIKSGNVEITFTKKTDMRKGIDGLATLIQDSFELDPYGDSIFLFSGWSKDRYKCLYFDGDGFAMLYKRLDNGKLQWPKNENEVRNLTQQELRWLLEGLSIQQPKAIQQSPKGIF